MTYSLTPPSLFKITLLEDTKDYHRIVHERNIAEAKNQVALEKFYLKRKILEERLEQTILNEELHALIVEKYRLLNII